MEELPLHIIHVIPSNLSGNEEVPNKRTTHPKQSIIIRSSTTTIDSDQLQGAPIPEEPRDLGGAPNHKGKSNWRSGLLLWTFLSPSSIRDTVKGGSERRKCWDSPQKQILMAGYWLFCCGVGSQKVPWCGVGMMINVKREWHENMRLQLNRTFQIVGETGFTPRFFFLLYGLRQVPKKSPSGLSGN